MTRSEKMSECISGHDFSGVIQRICLEQDRIRRHDRRVFLVVGSFLCCLVLFFGTIVWFQANTLSRQDPVLEYLYCHDAIVDAQNQAEAVRDKEETKLIKEILAAGDDYSPTDQWKIDEAARIYLQKNNEYIKLFPEFPTKCRKP